MWTGTNEDFFRLYAAASRAIKTRFPHLKVGGPSIGAPGDVVDSRLRPSPFLREFLRHCREHRLPLDFFSWHIYTDGPDKVIEKARAIRLYLDGQGFEKTETHLNEWNYLPDNDWSPLSVRGQGLPRQAFYRRMGGAEGAAFAACVLIGLLDAPVDVANFYSGDTNCFGLFSRHGVPRKTYHVFRAFGRLLDTPFRVKAAGGRPGRSAIAAGVNRERTAGTILIGRLAAEDNGVSLHVDGLPWSGRTRWEQFVLDETSDLKVTSEGEIPDVPCVIRLTMKAPCTQMIRLQKVP